MDTSALDLLILMFKDKTRTNFTNPFSSNDFKKDDGTFVTSFLKPNIDMSGPSFLQLGNPLQVKLSKMKRNGWTFTTEINNREDYADTGASSGASLCLFTTVIDTPVGIICAMCYVLV